MDVRQISDSLGKKGIIRNLGSWMCTISMILNGQRKWFLSQPGILKSLCLKNGMPKPSKFAMRMPSYFMFTRFSTKKKKYSTWHVVSIQEIFVKGVDIFKESKFYLFTGKTILQLSVVPLLMVHWFSVTKLTLEIILVLFCSQDFKWGSTALCLRAPGTM